MCLKISLQIDLKLKIPAVDAPIDLTWRAVDAYSKESPGVNLKYAGRTKGAELNSGLTFGGKMSYSLKASAH